MSTEIQQAPRPGIWSTQNQDQYPAPGPNSGYSAPPMIPFRPYENENDAGPGHAGVGSSNMQAARQHRYQPYPMPMNSLPQQQQQQQQQQQPQLQLRSRRAETPTNSNQGQGSNDPTSAHYSPSAAQLYEHAQMLAQQNNPVDPTAPHADDITSNAAAGVRLPPIMQVEKQQVTTSATQAASAGRRKNEAQFQCPVPGCGSTFTRRFNLRGHLRSHTEERPYVCQWPNCGKGFARQHDCKRHQSLHAAKSDVNQCPGCKRTFSRTDALNRHLRSETASDCKDAAEAQGLAVGSNANSTHMAPSPSSIQNDGHHDQQNKAPVQTLQTIMQAPPPHPHHHSLGPGGGGAIPALGPVGLTRGNENHWNGVDKNGNQL